MKQIRITWNTGHILPCSLTASPAPRSLCCHLPSACSTIYFQTTITHLLGARHASKHSNEKDENPTFYSSIPFSAVGKEEEIKTVSKFVYQEKNKAGKKNKKAIILQRLSEKASPRMWYLKKTWKKWRNKTAGYQATQPRAGSRANMQALSRGHGEGEGQREHGEDDGQGEGVQAEQENQEQQETKLGHY